MSAMKNIIERAADIASMGDYIGICTSCGNEQSGVEPDACNYICENCGEDQVFGAEEIMLEYYSNNPDTMPVH